MRDLVRWGLIRSFAFILLASDVVCYASKHLNGQEEFSENEQVKSLVVSSTGNVFVNTAGSIFQFRNKSILSEDLQFEIDTVGEISVFVLFNYSNDEYLLRCNHTSCFVSSVSDISQFELLKTYDEKLAGSSLGGEHSAEVFFKPCNSHEEFCHLYSAISGTRDTEIFSERIVYKDNGELYMYHRNQNVSFYIKSVPNQKFEFIYSFAENGFVYFLRNTLTDDGKSTAYISQICIENNHNYFRSYMESKLECNGYTTLTAAMLVQNSTRNILIVSLVGSETRYPGSILCKFSMDVVESYFAGEQRECFNGRKGRFPSWIEPPGEACNKYLPNKKIDCGYTGENTRIVFDGSLKNSNSHDYVVLTKRTEKMTSLILVPHGNIFVGYLGTNSGFLEKVLFDSSFGKPITVFRAPVSDDQGQIRSLTISSDGSRVYYIEDSQTRKTSRLYMIRTDTCEVHTDCFGCLTDILSCVWNKEPFNGVKPANGRCTSREAREKSAVVYELFCPPVVYDVQPKKGPVHGSTVLTLTGLMDNPAVYEIDYQKTGIPVSIRIGSVPCNVTDVTEFPQRLQCVTSKIETPGTLRVSLEMHNDVSTTRRNTFQKIMSKGPADYQPEFVYIDPVLFDTGTVVESVKLSGNIQLTIKGKNLDLGNSRRVVIGGSNCDITTTFDRFNDDEITCRAPKQNKTGNYTLVYEVDTTKVDGPVVTYIPEPVIHNIQPRSSIVSGGLTLTISGENLEGFGHNCQLNIEDSNSTAMNVSLCQISYQSTDTILLCKTSALDTLNSLPFLAGPSLSYIYGKVKTLGRFPLLIVEDPVMERDTKVIPISLNANQTQIFFKGSVLANISTNDVKIVVGLSRCIVNEVKEDGIVCEMFDLKSVPDGLKERVKCTIGYRTYNLGTVAIQVTQDRLIGTSTPVTLDDNYDSVVVACVVIIGLVLIIVVGIGVRKIKRKMHRSRDEPYNVHYRRDSNILTLDGLSESHTSDVIQNRQNDYQEHHRYLRGGADTTFVKETEPLLPIIDEDTRALFEQKNLIIANECLILGEIIGQGHFGCVYKGYFTLPNEKAEKIVACKTLHRNNPKDLDVSMFLKEALLMKDFHHKNVMELIGICLGVDKLPLVVLPFMRKGDVLSFIRNVENQPTVKELVVFGVDIANGMHYLSQLKFIHRDLAARNCMIDDNMNVKVADFGLSRDVYEKEYYSSSDKKAQLPVKWMSPESLEFGLFTHKSDVWSFGIVLWELLTRGVNPYPTVDNWDILKYLKEGRRLNKPDFCPDEMYRIMQQCWDWNPDERPLFGDLTIKIPELLRKLERASEKRKQLETSY